MSERIIEGDSMPEDARIERAVRPKTLAEYEGQPKVRDQMQLFVDAARNRSEPLDHTLILARQGWVRQRLPTSSRMKWVHR